MRRCMKIEYVQIVFVTSQGYKYEHYNRAMDIIQTYQSPKSFRSSIVSKLMSAEWNFSKKEEDSTSSIISKFEVEIKGKRKFIINLIHNYYF